MRRAGLLLTVALSAFLVQDVAAGTAPAAVSLSIGAIPKVSVRGARYSASRVDDLEITATLAPQVRGAHRLALKVFTPRGHLYQTLALPFAAPAAPSRRRPPIVSQRVSARVPVSGTLIVTSSLYGRWRVVPYLDDAAQPCGRELRFEIAR
jgi:hypothetical protein